MVGALSRQTSIVLTYTRFRLVDLGQKLIDLGVTRLLRGSYNHLRLQRLNVSYVSNIVVFFRMMLTSLQEMKQLILDDRTLWGM